MYVGEHTLAMTALDTQSFSSEGHAKLYPLTGSNLDVKLQTIRDHLLQANRKPVGTCTHQRQEGGSSNYIRGGLV